MKKLLAILVIVMLAVPMFAGTDILNFMWFNNKIGFAFSDRYNMPSATQKGGTNGGTGTDANAAATGSGLNYYNFIEQFMCGMWGTAYDGDPIKIKMDFFNYFSCEMGDFTSLTNATLQLNEQIRFKGIMDVGSMYSLAIGGKAFTRVFPLDTAGVKDNPYDSRWGFMGIGLLLENTIKIPNILDIIINSEFTWVQWGNQQQWGREMHQGINHTDLYIYLTAGLSGSYSFGFSWSLTQQVNLKLNLENVAGNIVTKTTGYDGGILGAGAQPEWFSNTPEFKTSLSLSQDILSLAGVKDVTLKVTVDELLLIQAPYSYWTEQTKLINTQGKYGLVVGFYGFSVGGFFTFATQDSYNTSVPVNGGLASSWVKGTEVIGSGSRNPGRGQAGVLISFSYSRGFFGFDFAYHGQGQIRDCDYSKNNYSGIYNQDSNLTVDNGGLYRIDLRYFRWSNMLSCSINFSW